MTILMLLRFSSMPSTSPRRLRPLRICLAALGAQLAIVQAAPAQQEQITFAEESYSDLRGILDVFDAFRSACLEQAVSRSLPEKLLPDGYRIVSSSAHLLGLEAGQAAGSVVLSRTGSEEGDHAGGYPYIVLSYPTDAAPFGKCQVAWKAAWDYADGVKAIMTSTAVVFDAWLSYRLKAVRLSRPEETFRAAETYGLVSEWAAPCFGGNWCRLEPLLELSLNEGIYLVIDRGDPPDAPADEP